MQQRALVLEAHHTTHIEGTHLTLDQAERILAGQRVPEANPEDARELLNYRMAFDLVAEYLGNGQPITEGLVREIHRRLVQGVRGDAARPGEYRRVQNYVVNAATGETIYTPPPARDVPHLMADLVAWLNGEEEASAVLTAGIAQFQLVHIHPFLDGNGRTARLLSTLCLYRSGYDFKRLFTISEYYDRDRSAYYRAIQSVRERGMDHTRWLEYFTTGLAAQMREVQERGVRVIRRDVLLAKARKRGLKDRPIAVLAFLLDRGKATISECQTTLKANRRTLQRDLKALVRKGFAREVGTGPTDPTKRYEPIL
jgi:Fic family protein